MKTKVHLLSLVPGALPCLLAAHDGNRFHAPAFAQAGNTLTPDQEAGLGKLRNPDTRFICQGACWYSQAIPLPESPNTYFLTSAPAAPLIPARPATQQPAKPATNKFIS